MAHSLSEACTPLKLEYDSCFNSWFEGYLQPVVGNISPEARRARNVEKKMEFDQRCGKIWESYRSCVQKAVKESGLTATLQEARQEHPLPTIPDVPSDSSRK